MRARPCQVREEFLDSLCADMTGALWRATLRHARWLSMIGDHEYANAFYWMYERQKMPDYNTWHLIETLTGDEEPPGDRKKILRRSGLPLEVWRSIPEPISVDYAYLTRAKIAGGGRNGAIRLLAKALDDCNITSKLATSESRREKWIRRIGMIKKAVRFLLTAKVSLFPLRRLLKERR